MKKIISIAVLAGLLSTPVAQATDTVDIVIATQLLSKYVGNAGAVFHAGAVQQTEITATLKSGIYFDIWHSMAWRDHSSQNEDGEETMDYGNEIDWTIGWSGDLGESGFTIDAGVSYFDCANLWQTEFDTINPYVTIGYSTELTAEQKLSTSVKVELPVVVGENFAGNHGTYITAGVEHTWQASEKLSLSHGPSLIIDDNPYEMDKGLIGRYQVSADYALTEKVSLNATVSASSPLTSMSDRETEIVSGVGLKISF